MLHGDPATRLRRGERRLCFYLIKLHELPWREFHYHPKIIFHVFARKVKLKKRRRTKKEDFIMSKRRLCSFRNRGCEALIIRWTIMVLPSFLPLQASPWVMVVERTIAGRFLPSWDSIRTAEEDFDNLISVPQRQLQWQKNFQASRRLPKEFMKHFGRFLHASTS